MKNIIKRTAISAMALCVAGAALAQSLTPIGAAVDWTVFQDPSNSKYCYIVSSPTNSKAMKDGAEVSVNRGDIRLYIGIKNGATEPSFLAGYPLANDKAVEAKIGGQVFNYFTNSSANAEYAWPSPNSDAQLISSMKKGSNVIVTGLSQRGTQTIDTFSLSGFTAAYNKAVETCAS